MRLGKRQHQKSRSTRQKNRGSTKSNDDDTSLVVGRVSLDLMSSVYLPKIEKIAIESMERYANEYVQYEELKRDYISNNNDTTTTEEAEIGTDGSIHKTSRNRNIPIPPKKILFYSEHQFNDFKKNVLYDISDHFFAEKGGWKIEAKAARFERMLDERYGIFRPLITSHPEIDQLFRTVQRKYARGYFSPFRKTPPPISRGNAVILLFMMHRGNVSWQIKLLTTLFLLVGLQPWALVGIISLFKLLTTRRKRMPIGYMKKVVPSVQPYYRVGLESKDIDSINKRKQDMLLTPVGTSLEHYSDITDTSNFDIIMLGSGPGTLYTAALLARAGRKILVLCPEDDASGCLTMQTLKANIAMNIPSDIASIPFDVEGCNISKISRQQQLMVPALCTETDYQGGIRFAQIGSEDDGYAFEILSVPGMGTDIPDQQNPFVICAAGGLETLMGQAASILGDGWPDGDGDIGQSATGAYVMACEAINTTSSSYYISKNLPDSVNKLRSSAPYQDCTLRHASAFLNKMFPLNVHTRSLMAAIGMKMENAKPSMTSMAAHVTNVCATLSGEGMHYPIGGPRALCHAFATVIEQNGGRIVCSAQATEFVFDESITPHKTKSSGNEDNEDLPPPCCVGVKLEDGRIIRFEQSRYTGSTEKWPAVISMEGFINTFIRRLSDDIRTKYKVPRGLPALSERRPVIHILFALKGNATYLNITGADFFRLPGAAVARDEIDPESGEITYGELGWSDEDQQVEDEELQKVIESELDETKNETKSKEQAEARKKRRQVKFTSGASWLHISFPSAKDPSFESRHGQVTTCVVTIEADDDFAVLFDTKPKIYVIKKTASTSGDLQRLFERVKKDLLSIYPQFEGKILHSEIRGPYAKGLRHNPERYAAKGIRPSTPYPGLFAGGTDLTVDTFSGSTVAGWLVANSVANYKPVDHLFLSKNITSDIEQFLEPPMVSEDEDLAVPVNNTPRCSALEEDISNDN